MQREQAGVINKMRKIGEVVVYVVKRLIETMIGLFKRIHRVSSLEGEL
jgi:hypothetical protein